MSGITLYAQDQLVRLSALFEDADGLDVDPATVQLTVTSPSGITTVYTFGGSPDTVTKDSIGTYHVDVTANESGDWFTQWESTGEGAGVQEGQFMVAPSRF
jgi:uncharacterized protein YfaS (alpha-2-macroglobulin family)